MFKKAFDSGMLFAGDPWDVSAVQKNVMIFLM